MSHNKAGSVYAATVQRHHVLSSASSMPPLLQLVGCKHDRHKFHINVIFD